MGKKKKIKKTKSAPKKIVKKTVTKALKKKVNTKKTQQKKGKKGLTTVYLGIGSNVGDREEYIEQAVFLFDKSPDIEVVRRSANYETEPEGNTEQPAFINAVLVLKTKLDPHALLDLCHEVEATLGRERDVEWGPRTCDIDILLYGDKIISDENLQIPHALLHERLFVLKPLREVAPHVIHPIIEKSISALYEDRKTEIGETYDDELPGFKE
ncbi:MAG: 2-amino-4-hydroxy-6-hydroxymethyldihydropteridine diphosphokinase, partial [bacterium]